MPIYEPGGTIDIVLPGDELKPNPVVFVASALSCRQAKALKQEIDSALEATNDYHDTDAIEAILKRELKGWRNARIEFDQEAVLDVVGPQDIWRLGYAIARQIQHAEKKS